MERTHCCPDHQSARKRRVPSEFKPQLSGFWKTLWPLGDQQLLRLIRLSIRLMSKETRPTAGLICSDSAASAESWIWVQQIPTRPASLWDHPDNTNPLGVMQVLQSWLSWAQVELQVETLPPNTRLLSLMRFKVAPLNEADHRAQEEDYRSELTHR